MKHYVGKTTAPKRKLPYRGEVNNELAQTHDEGGLAQEFYDNGGELAPQSDGFLPAILGSECLTSDGLLFVKVDSLHTVRGTTI